MTCFREVPWQFPIFLSTPAQLDSWCQFHPRSDFMISSRSFLFPFLISEVILQRNEQDRYRMLLQAIAVARAGQYLMEAGAPMRFFVVAVYLHADLTVERYVVTHTGPGRKVCRSVHPPFVFLIGSPGIHWPEKFCPYYGRGCGRVPS